MKEREKEKIALKEIEKEAPPPPASPVRAHAGACTGAREATKLPPVINVKTPPTLELLLAFAHVRCDYFDDDFTREWFRVMNDEYMWCYPETGEPIRHWPAYFRLWRVKRKLFEKLNDPDRIPDRTAVRLARGPRKADNWIGTPPDRIEDVF